MLKIFAIYGAPLKGSMDRYTDQWRYDTGFANFPYDRYIDQLNSRDMKVNYTSIRYEMS